MHVCQFYGTILVVLTKLPFNRIIDLFKNVKYKLFIAVAFYHLIFENNRLKISKTKIRQNLIEWQTYLRKSIIIFMLRK